VRDMCSRARIYVMRISLGTSSGIGFSVLSTTGSGVVVTSAGTSGAGVGVGSSSGVWVNAFLKKTFTDSGILIENNGALVRAITTVVAMYIGIAAKIKMPNTMPANPCKCACIN